MKVLLSDISFSKHFYRCWHIWVTVFKSNLWMANPLIFFPLKLHLQAFHSLSFSDPKAFGWCWADITLRGGGAALLTRRPTCVFPFFPVFSSRPGHCVGHLCAWIPCKACGKSVRSLPGLTTRWDLIPETFLVNLPVTGWRRHFLQRTALRGPHRACGLRFQARAEGPRLRELPAAARWQSTPHDAAAMARAGKGAQRAACRRAASRGLRWPPRRSVSQLFPGTPHAPGITWKHWTWFLLPNFKWLKPAFSSPKEN